MKTNLERCELFKWLPGAFPDRVEDISDVERAKTKIMELWSDSPNSEHFVEDFVANLVVASSSDHRHRKEGAGSQRPAV